jgi:hypothetical protein
MSDTIASIEDLEALYGEPGPSSLVKVSPVITAQYRRLIEASPFCGLATAGLEGLDCSPRGDAPENGLSGLVRIEDEATLLMPDRRGNNRIDSLRNIVRDPRVALMFLIPGSGTTLRLNGKAYISVAPQLLESFAVKGKAPRSVIVIKVAEVYFQCARAVVRADLWNPARHADVANLPTPGEILAEQSSGEVGGKAYDEAWPDRAKESMW